MKMRHRRTMLLTSLLAICSLFSGFLASQPARASTPTVTVWTWRAQDAPLWKQVQDQLKAKKIDVNIQFRGINATSYDSVLLTAMDGGNGPDIFYGRAGSGTINYAYAKLIEPLNGFVDLKSVAKDTLPQVEYKHKYYGVPFAVQTMSVFYNKDIFSKYHLTPPKTWSQFISMCQKLKKASVTPIAAMGVQGWMLALDFDEVAATMLSNSWVKQLVARKTTYDSAPYIDALAHFQQLSQFFEDNFQAVGSADSEQDQYVALGRAAMTLDGIFDVQQIDKFNPNAHLGTFLIPPASKSQTAKVEWYTDGDIAMNSHISDSAVKKAAEKIVAFTATKQFGQDFSDLAGEISPIKGVKIPSKYPLSLQSYHWFQKVPIHPLFDIRSSMDTPPPAPPTSSVSKVNTTQGVFAAEQAVMLPLLEKKMTPTEAGKKVQSTDSWYFKK